MADRLTFRLRDFSGPLDLLLALITAHKMDIYDIPIAEILEQYLEQIARMQSEDMAVAAEFLEMAARLIYIKTAQLLPRNEVAEEMKRQITEELLEYRDIKAAAEMLRSHGGRIRTFVRKPMPAPARPYDGRVSPERLLDAYSIIAGRVKQKSEGSKQLARFSEVVQTKPVSVASRVTLLIRKLVRGGETPYGELFDLNDSPSGRVATFLAMLELLKARRLLLREDEEGYQLVRLADPDGEVSADGTADLFPLMDFTAFDEESEPLE